MCSKDRKKCTEFFKTSHITTKELQNEFRKFSTHCSEKSELCRFLEILLDLTVRLKHLIVADREGDWEAHLTAVKNLLPVFRSADSIHYLRYASWYLEKMRILPTEHQEIYQHFMTGKFVVQTSHGRFCGVAPDIKLEQTIQRSKK